MEQYNLTYQHNKGKYHAIERIQLLLDKKSFQEIGSGIANHDFADDGKSQAVPYDGVITGSGTIHEKPVFIFAQDFSIKGGSLGLRHGRKIAHLIALAIQSRKPIIGIYDSGGARINEGMNALAGCGELMHQNTLASGYIPQISIIVGPCAGAAAYSPALTDFVFIVDSIGSMYITGPEVIKKVTRETCSLQELGGAQIHTEKSGVSHSWFADEKSCFETVRKLVDVLPSHAGATMDIITHAEKKRYFIKAFSKEAHVPSDKKKPYDIRTFINGFIDAKSMIEMHSSFAQEVVVCFAQLSGMLIGIVANQPMVNSGCLSCDSSDKAARFVRFCDAFDIPIITLVDTPGYLPGVAQEHNGIIRHGAKLLYAYAEASCAKITLIIRKAYGGAYIAMGSKHLGADYVYALPIAEIAVMGSEGAASVLYRSEMSKLPDEEKEAYLAKKTQEYTQQFMNTNIAVREGYVDEVISAEEVRMRIYSNLMILREKNEQLMPKKKHGNIPL